MPALTLTFDPDEYLPVTQTPWWVVPPAGPPAVNAHWQPWVRWFDLPTLTNPLGPNTGLYIIEDNSDPIYAGMALSFANRFEGRSRVLREFGLDSNALPMHTVRTATVAPGGWPNVPLAERWLIRYLYCRDFANPPERLQNVQSTGSFPAPPGGLSIRYDPNDAPGYLHDAFATGSAGWVVVNANSVGFNYAAGTPVFP